MDWLIVFQNSFVKFAPGSGPGDGRVRVCSSHPPAVTVIHRRQLEDILLVHDLVLLVVSPAVVDRQRHPSYRLRMFRAQGHREAREFLDRHQPLGRLGRKQHVADHFSSSVGPLACVFDRVRVTEPIAHDVGARTY
jgi:hypothetical protein